MEVFCIGANFKFSGIRKYEKQLSKLINEDEMVKKALRAGADLIADEVRKNIEAIPVRSNEYGSEKKRVTGLTKAGKEGLLNSLGISPSRENKGIIDVKIGFDGYNSQKTKKYPKGQPNWLIAYGVEKGTSWLEKTPFMAPAVRNKKAAAEKAMSDALDAAIKQIIK